MVKIRIVQLLLAGLLLCGAVQAKSQSLNNTKVDGYRGIWFTLGQEKEYGYKYSGGLGTYTMKHIPLAVYSPEVDKTFFVYGGTPSKKARHLLCMAGCYDHKTGKVCRPTVVFDKEKVNDPHDNPSMQIDKDGYIWVFVSGRGTKRPGHIYKSEKPYDIGKFKHVKTWPMTYPQVTYLPDKGFFLNFTQYTGLRRLYYSTSKDGRKWTDVKLLADIKEPGDSLSGQYQVSNNYGDKIVTCFNRHKNGNVDTRTNIYYLQTTDMGKTWTTASGKPVATPVRDLDNDALILDAQSKGRNVYIKDVNFDSNGNPVILYLTSGGCQPGPCNAPFQWYTAYWNGKRWDFNVLTTSTHNYDSGSIWTEGDEWCVIAPTDEGPQKWCTGGEIVMWRSSDKGVTWRRDATLTADSRYNHGYVRRPVKAKDPFYGFWADGNPERLTQSKLYFTDSKGNVMELPYDMEDEWDYPVVVRRQESMKDVADRVFSAAAGHCLAMDKVLPQNTMPRSWSEAKGLYATSVKGWCSGFYPGELWYIYEYTGLPEFKALAEKHTATLTPQQHCTTTHDVGFQVNCSFGNGYRLTGKDDYLKVMENTALSLATRFSPVIGATQSWNLRKSRDWQFPVIIDNMMNLELLMEVGKRTGRKDLCAMAESHADLTLRNHFRPDFTTYHLVDYDTVTGKARKHITVQGFADESAWARGQAWALYGYTMMFEQTGKEEYLARAENIGRMILDKLPADGIPYWDFDVEVNSSTPRDASSAAVMASAFVRLSTLTTDRALGNRFLRVSELQLRELASPSYLAAPGTNGNFLLRHSTGSLPGKSEIDVPLSYADYYYLEALIRFLNVEKGA